MKIIEKEGKDLIIYKFPEFVNKNKEIGNSLEDFEILKVIENNEFSKIIKVRSKRDFGIYAIKKISLKFIKDYNLYKDIDFFKQAKHPNILKYYGCFYDKDNLYLIMEFMNNRDFESYYKLNQALGIKIPYEKILKIFYIGLDVLDYIHRSNMRRHIYLNDILLDDNFNIKIGILDFPTIISNHDEEKNDIQVLADSLKELINNGVVSSGENYLFQEDRLKDIKIDYSNYNDNCYKIKRKVKESYIKYAIKNNSLKAIFNCLNRYRNIRNYFTDNYVTEFIKNDDKNKIVSKQVLNIINTLNDVNNNNTEAINDSLYEFRKALENTCFYNVKDDVEINPENLLPFILMRLNTELNEIALLKNREDDKEIKENNDKQAFCCLNKNIWIKSENEEQTRINFEDIFNSYNQRIFSFISRNFISFIQTITTCKTKNCFEKKVEFSWIYFVWIPMNQINNYQSFLNNLNGSYFLKEIKKGCQYCGKETKFDKKKIFYKAAKNLIVIFDTAKKNENENIIALQPILKLNNEYDKSIKTYNLVGLITKKMIRKELNANNQIRYEYFYYINEKLYNYLNYKNKKEEIPIILFYELDLNAINKQFQYNISYPKTDLMLERKNSDFSNLFNDFNGNIHNNINNYNTFNINNNFNNNTNLNNFNNNNNYIKNNTAMQQNSLMNNQSNVNLNLNKINSTNNYNLSSNKRFNVNNQIYNNMNSNITPIYNNNNDYKSQPIGQMNMQQTNNLNHMIYQKNSKVNEINQNLSNNINYNNRPSNNRNESKTEDKIPIYENGNSSDNEGEGITELIKGKIIYN